MHQNISVEDQAAKRPIARSNQETVASLVLAAGKGSRMAGYDGSKPLLPLLPSGPSPFEGTRPILLHIISNLPPGPVAVVVHYLKDQVIEATSRFSPAYCFQPVLNGTGGALLAARGFLKENAGCRIIITMGDVPLVRTDTYAALAGALDSFHMTVLAFSPSDRKRYGLIETNGGFVRRIVEWEYWHRYDPSRISEMNLCNSGIYAVRGTILNHYLPVMESRPHRVVKRRDGDEVSLDEYFITDLVEYLSRDGLHVGFIEAADEDEVMGVDDPEALGRAQRLYLERFHDRS